MTGGLDRWLRMDLRRAVMLALAWFAAVMLHNVTYALLRSWFPAGWDEPVFFTLALIVLPAYAAVSLIYTLVTTRVHRRQ